MARLQVDTDTRIPSNRGWISDANPLVSGEHSQHLVVVAGTGCPCLPTRSASLIAPPLPVSSTTPGERKPRAATSRDFPREPGNFLCIDEMPCLEPQLIGIVKVFVQRNFNLDETVTMCRPISVTRLGGGARHNRSSFIGGQRSLRGSSVLGWAIARPKTTRRDSEQAVDILH